MTLSCNEAKTILNKVPSFWISVLCQCSSNKELTSHCSSRHMFICKTESKQNLPPHHIWSQLSMKTTFLQLQRPRLTEFTNKMASVTKVCYILWTAVVFLPPFSTVLITARLTSTSDLVRWLLKNPRAVIMITMMFHFRRTLIVFKFIQFSCVVLTLILGISFELFD